MDEENHAAAARPEPRAITRALAWLVMVVTPLCFSTNLIFGRSIVGDVAPFTLAFIRWSAVALALSPFVFGERDRIAGLLRDAPLSVFLQGFLGMWVCGAIVYMGLGYTTATNATLIYTTSPAIIIGLEALSGARKIGLRQAAGLVIAFAGVGVIVLKGSLAALISLSFNLGDLLIAAAAFSWAIYSIRLRSPAFRSLGGPALFGLISACGAILLLPFAAMEMANGPALPVTPGVWRDIAGIIVFASLLAFSGFQFGVRVHGPSITGIFMYLMPVYGVFLSVAALGETAHAYHEAGIVLVLGGVVLATYPGRRSPA